MSTNVDNRPKMKKMRLIPPLEIVFRIKDNGRLKLARERELGARDFGLRHCLALLPPVAPVGGLNEDKRAGSKS